MELTLLPVAVLALAASAAGGGPAERPAEPTREVLLGAAVTVDLSGAPREPIVRVEYRLPAGAARLPFRLLQCPDAVAGVPEGGGDENVTLEIERFDERAIAGSVGLPASGKGMVRVTLRYTVEQLGPEGRYRLPLPVPLWPPAEGAGDVFVATVLAPAGSALRDPFPSRARRREGSGSLYAFELPAVPSQLAFEFAPEGAASVGAGRWIDLAAAALLAGLTLYGWRRLRGELA